MDFNTCTFQLNDNVENEKLSSLIMIKKCLKKVFLKNLPRFNSVKIMIKMFKINQKLPFSIQKNKIKTKMYVTIF